MKALLHIRLPALERDGHLKLDEEIRPKVLSMSAATIDRLARLPKNTTRIRKPVRVVPEPRRRIKMRTFADWNEPPSGGMEMDLVAHCGEVNRGSYVHSLVLTGIASGWTEGAPIVVSEGSLVVETLERIRPGLPFALRALDVDNGLRTEASPFANDVHDRLLRAARIAEASDQARERRRHASRLIHVPGAAERQCAGNAQGKETVADRMMFGSDWHMLSKEKNWPLYAQELVASVRAVSPGSVEKIFGENAKKCFWRKAAAFTSEWLRVDKKSVSFE